MTNALTVFVLALAGACLAGQAQAASLVGAEVTCQITGDSSNRTCTNPTSGGSSFIVSEMGGMPDLLIESSTGDDILEINFMNQWVDITAASGLISTEFGDGVTLSFSGLLDQSADPAEFRTVHNLSITDAAGLTASDFSFPSAGTLAIDLSNVTFGSEAAVGFDVAVPLPAPAFLLIAGLAGLGLASRRRA